MYKVFTKAANCAARKPSRDSYTLKVLLTRLIRRHELFALHIRFKEVMREDIEGSTTLCVLDGQLIWPFANAFRSGLIVPLIILCM